MRYLLDTCTFLWLVATPARLPPKVAALLQRGGEDAILSVGSVWEIAIKHGLGRLDLPEPPDRYLPDRMAYYQIEGLDIGLQHVVMAGALPSHHNDPFDRLLIAQAIIEDLTILTPDRAFAPYGVKVMW